MNFLKSFRLEAGSLIRRSLFVLVLLALTLGNLYTLFRGLNSSQAMEQAQIAREIYRGKGFTTKAIRPVAYHQAESKVGKAVAYEGFQDTYHSPLNPLINAAVFKLLDIDKSKTWEMTENQMVYPLDRVVAIVSTMFFLMAIGMSYLLISRIFDPKIAGVSAILMLFCQTFWDYSLSGLPQMLMLFLFSCGMYFAYRAVEAAAEGKISMIPAVIAGIFFTLLALTHWMTVWIALGYIIYVAIALRPRGIVAVIVLLILLVPGVFVMLRNHEITGSPFGTAFLTLYNGMGGNSEAQVMRISDFQTQPLDLDGLLGKTLKTMLLQVVDIIPLLAGIVVAPLFFLSLLHPFKRPAIANFRWTILLMWVFTALGLCFFGVSTSALDPNQLHLLFAPLMTAYGLAFVSILWSRLEIVGFNPALRNVHHIIIIIICALPLILSLPNKIRLGLHHRDKGGLPHWPPYYAPALASTTSGLKGWVTDKQIVFSDQPWAVAWYTDRMSIWLPPDREGFEKLDAVASDLQTPVVGILISPSSHGSGPISEVTKSYKDFAPLVIDGRVLLATYPPGITVFDKSPKIQEIYKRFPFRQPLVGMDMVFYSERVIRTEPKIAGKE
jgi:hypothetical protein